MKHDWKYIKLGDIISPAKVVRNGANKKFPVLSITMRDGIVLQSSRFKKSIASVDTSDYKVVYNGQLVIAFPIDEGLIYTQDIVDAGIMSPAYNVWNVDFLEIDRKFLVLYLHCPFSMAYYKSKLRGTTMRRRSMPKEDLLNMPLPVPSFSVQQSIVSELDKINELIRLKKEQLKDYDNLAQSIFYEMFGDPVVNEKGWDFKKIGEIGTVERGAGISKKDFVEDGLPCIHYGQLHTILGPTTRHHHSCIPESLLPKYKIAHTNDVIMAITSEDVEGSCKSTAWLGNYDIVIGSDAAILHHEQDGTFLSYYTMTKAFFNEKSKYAKGFKVTHISAKEIENIPVYLPPLALQKDFAKRIEVIEHQKENIKSTIQDLETLLASRMQYWFD